MNTNIINPVEQIVKWQVVIDATTDLKGIPDGIYPYNGLVDQWVLVMAEQAVNWSCTYGAICLMEIEAMRVQKKHVTRNPANGPSASSGHGLGAWWTVRTADYMATVDRETGEVSYDDC